MAFVVHRYQWVPSHRRPSLSLWWMNAPQRPHFTHMHCLGIFEITTLWPGQWRVDPWRGTEERGKDKGTLPGHPHIAPPEPPLTESIQLNFFWMWIGQAHTWSRSQCPGHASMHACVPLTSRASIFESRIHLDPEWPGSTYGLIGSIVKDSQLS